MRRRLPLIGGVLGALAGAVVVAAIVAFFALLKLYREPSASMQPSLGVGDRVAVLRFAGPVEPDVGDIVAYEVAAEECGAPGKVVYLHRIVARRASGRFVMRGDNVGVSCDSRVFGPVARVALIGEVVAVYWPPSRWGFR